MPAGSTRQQPSPTRRPCRPRRGVTLVEMLVVVALIVLMMTILVQIFQSATGAMSASRITQELDVNLRQIDSMIRADLNGVTAKMTPPNDPALKTGYFEYGENSPADAQGEDTDDYLAFTVKAPEGQVFTGRQWLSNLNPTTGSQTINQNIQPVTVTSQVAEIIYFLRNGNLYRRIFLVAPERASSLYVSLQVGSPGPPFTAVNNFGLPLRVSWQGLNEISCRPGPINSIAPTPNDLGDLTNRENRAFRPRFCNDFVNADGVADDNNGDGIDDYYPTLYYDGVGHVRTDSTGNQVDWVPNNLIAEVQPFLSKSVERVEQGTTKSHDVYAFPFIYPGMYSVPDGASVNASGNVTPPTNGLGWRHGLLPFNDPSLGLVPNHGALDVGDNLHAPAGNQTWWGFPTWRETMAGLDSGGGTNLPGWADPLLQPNRNGHQQVNGLRPIAPNLSYSIKSTNINLLPPIYLPNSSLPVTFHDGAGSASFVADPLSGSPTQSVPQNRIWEDDLILTGVRSFDVKAYDINAPLYNAPVGSSGSYTNGPFSSGYQDLGYGVEHGYGASTYAYGPNGQTGTTTPVSVPWQPGLGSTPYQPGSAEPIGFGHAGRIPPLFSDYRLHPRRPTYNVGDNSAGIIRLNRVWDSWSTDYTNAPDSDVFLNQYSAASQPIYPSFPAPYPSPLRGIQIQIRLVDPRGERSKPLTIRHDFTDKL